MFNWPGLEICDVELDKAVLLKNRAAVNLKCKDYEAVIKVDALDLGPGLAR